MYAITTIKPIAGATIKHFPQADPLRAIERLALQAINSGQAAFITIIATDYDGHQTDITLGGTEK